MQPIIISRALKFIVIFMFGWIVTPLEEWNGTLVVQQMRCETWDFNVREFGYTKERFLIPRSHSMTTNGLFGKTKFVFSTFRS